MPPGRGAFARTPSLKAAHARLLQRIVRSSLGHFDVGLIRKAYETPSVLSTNLEPIRIFVVGSVRASCHKGLNKGHGQHPLQKKTSELGEGIQITMVCWHLVGWVSFSGHYGQHESTIHKLTLEGCVPSTPCSISKGMRGQWTNDEGKKNMSTPP